MLKQDVVKKLQSNLNEKREDFNKKLEQTNHKSRKEKMPKATFEECEDILDSFMDIVTEALKNNDEVKIVNFGSFKMRKIAEHDGVDPVTKKKVRVKETAVPYFKVSKALKTAVLS